MKIELTTMLTILSILLTVGCSRKGAADTPLQYTLARGISPPRSRLQPRFRCKPHLQPRGEALSDAKDAALLKFAQQHPGQDIQILLSGRVLTNLRMPARGSSPASAIAIGAAFDSPNEAQTIAASLNQLVQ